MCFEMSVALVAYIIGPHDCLPVLLQSPNIVDLLLKQ